MSYFIIYEGLDYFIFKTITPSLTVCSLHACHGGVTDSCYLCQFLNPPSACENRNQDSSVSMDLQSSDCDGHLFVVVSLLHLILRPVFYCCPSARTREELFVLRCILHGHDSNEVSFAAMLLPTCLVETSLLSPSLL